MKAGGGIYCANRCTTGRNLRPSVPGTRGDIDDGAGRLARRSVESSSAALVGRRSVDGCDSSAPRRRLQRAPARGAALDHLVPADGRTAIINGTNPGLRRGRPTRYFREQEQARLRGEELTFAFVEPANDEIVLGGGSYGVDLEQSLRGRLLASAGGFHPADCQTPTPKAMSSRAAITSPQRRPASFGDPLGIHDNRSCGRVPPSCAWRSSRLSRMSLVLTALQGA